MSTPPASPDGIRRAVLDVLAATAPESDAATLDSTAPLREQIELDSMDWMNFASALEQRLGVVLPEGAWSRLATLDELVAALAAAPRIAALPPPGPLQRRHRLGETDITLRPIRREDAPMEAEFVRRLSDRSRYQRFMGTLRELPPDKLRDLTDVDGVHHVALVATTRHDGREVELGVARYVVDDRGTGCEFAVAVDDAWQHSGLAGLLMDMLIDTARSRGLQHMEGRVLATNREMLRFARQLGFEVQADPGDATTRRVLLTL